MKAIKSLALVGAATGLLVGGAGAAAANDGAQGAAIGSPGFISGNVTQVVTNVQANLCGNSTNAGIAFLNPTFGNACVNR
ncbi:MAG: chaplin [Streptomyces sp.]|uniref:chaplin n=1 Tax=Streptomyces sp. TaxID=1931 RepID=UPI003D6B6C45